MKLRKSFVTVFTAAQNFHLVKDVGQIPYFMYKMGLCQGKLVTYPNNDSYPYLDIEVKGLDIHFISNQGRLGYYEKAVSRYLYRSAKEIDILNLFHFKKDNIVYLLLYKSLNRKGKVYIKLDMDIHFFKKYNSFFYSHYRIKNYFLNFLTKIHFRLTDIFSVETEEARKYLIETYPELKNKLICLPNGIDDEFIDKNIAVKTFEEKENLIIAVGRIGTFQKNTELLMEALLGFDLQTWKVMVIGPIEEGFQQYIDKYYNSNPEMIGRLVFTGNVTDRIELFEYYNRAKIFCMTSRFEGYPISFSEAQYFGNYIISTIVSSSTYVTGEGRYGTVCGHTAIDVARGIKKAIANGFLNGYSYNEIRSFAKGNLTWPVIVNRLKDHLDINE